MKTSRRIQLAAMAVSCLAEACGPSRGPTEHRRAALEFTPTTATVTIHLSFRGAPITGISAEGIEVLDGGFLATMHGADSDPIPMVPGNHQIFATPGGCFGVADELGSVEVNLTAGETTTVDLDLSSRSGIATGTITLNGSPGAATVAVSTSCGVTQHFTSASDGSITMLLNAGTTGADILDSAGGAVAHPALTLPVGQTTAVGTLDASVGDLAGTISWNGPLPPKTTPNLTIVEGPLDHSSYGWQVGAPGGAFVMKGLKTGVHPLRLYAALGTSNQQLLASTTVTVARGVQTNVPWDITGDVGVVTGALATGTTGPVGAGVSFDVFSGDGAFPTDDHARFWVLLPPGHHELVLVTGASANGSGILVNAPFDITAGNTTDLDVLLDVGSVQGTVFWAGAPLSAVDAQGLEIDSDELTSISAVSPAGTYSVASIETGAIFLQGIARDALDDHLFLGSSSVTVSQGTTAVADLDLTATAGRLRGSISVDGPGVPPGGFGLLFDPIGAPRALQRTTDTAGRFELLLPPGNASVEFADVSLPAFGGIRTIVNAGATTDVGNIRIVNVHGTIFVNGRQATAQEATGLWISESVPQVVQTLSAPTYSAYTNESDHSLSLYAGGCSFATNAPPGLLLGRVGFVTAGPTTADFDLASTAGRLDVTITQNGAPFPSAKVDVLTTVSGDTCGAGQLADADGHVSMILPPGSYTATVEEATGNTVGSFPFTIVAGHPTFMDGGPALASGCTSNDDCGSGFCADGMCCDSACSSFDSAHDCQACSRAAGGSADGHCTTFAAGTVCNASTGGCDPAERCDGASPICPDDQLALPGTICQTPANACEAPAVCDGASASCPALAQPPSCGLVPPGTGVDVSLENGVGVVGGIDIKCAGTSTSGAMTYTPGTGGSAPPPDYEIVTGGLMPTTWGLATTATCTNPTTGAPAPLLVCFNYGPNAVSSDMEPFLVLMHDAGDGRGFVNINSSPPNPNPNTTTHVICGKTTSLSPFALMRPHSLPPVMTVPGDMTVDATSAAGAVVSYTATARDPEDGALTPTCAPPSGATFPIGATVVACAVTDSSGVSASATFTVTVRAVQSPAFGPVADPVTAYATSTAGAKVAYAAPTATDAVDGTVPVTCTPASGAQFHVGQTTVTCTATNKRGKSAQASFTVWVKYAAPADGSFFLFPIRPDGSSVFHAGLPVPVRFKLQGASAGITTLTAKLVVTKVSSAVQGTVDATSDESVDDTDFVFKYRPLLGWYAYRWRTRDQSQGTYQLRADLGDGVTHQINVSIKTK